MQSRILPFLFKNKTTRKLGQSPAVLKVIGISIKKDASVTALESEIQKYHLDEKFRNASFSLHTIDYEAKTYRDMKSEDKISDYFIKDPSMFDKHIHILVVSAVNKENL
ncbi:20654_t:CDS:2 [Funneliformis geosporum]|nr:20654_t:CDS:2 [Funneliformis geosporum]